MHPRALDVWWSDARVGTLADLDDGLAFAYDGAWLSTGGPPLSQSLPLGDEPPARAVSAFFGGLLPEGEPREVLARRLGVSVGNDFSLLEALGGDTAGALTLLAPGAGPPVATPGDVRWLDDDELAQEIRELPARPLRVDEDGEYRLSLAGAQDKLPVVVGADGRVGLTTGRTPSTHIMKTPIRGFDATVANEALCLRIGTLLGVPTVVARARRAQSEECLLVERYDRVVVGEDRRRLHQEDLCQALGVPADRKYQSDGGPRLGDCFRLLRGAVAVPARDVVRLLEQVALSFLVGNNDAHGKNFSLLYVPTTARPALAPAYDVLSTVVYRGARRMSRRMAMSWGAENRPEYVRARHLDALLADAGLGGAPARRRLRTLAARAPEAARVARAELAGDGWDHDVLGRVVSLVDQRAAWLTDLAASTTSAVRRG